MASLLKTCPATASSNCPSSLGNQAKCLEIWGGRRASSPRPQPWQDVKTVKVAALTCDYGKGGSLLAVLPNLSDGLLLRLAVRVIASSKSDCSKRRTKHYPHR